MARPKDARYDHHEPNALPASISVDIRVGYGIGRFNEGNIVIQEGEFSNSEDFATVELALIEVDIPLPEATVDIKGKKLEYLQKQKERILAENHMRLKEVDDKIASVLALEYKPAELDDDRPF